jgi:hypothetical protein
LSSAQIFVTEIIGAAVSNAAFAQERAVEYAQDVELERRHPFYLLKPHVYFDANQWCALYGVNLHSGVAEFGETPSAAAAAFDLEWLNGKGGMAKDSSV